MAEYATGFGVGAVREEIQWLIRQALELPDGRKLNAMVNRLRRLSKGDCGTERIQAQQSRQPKCQAQKYDNNLLILLMEREGLERKPSGIPVLSAVI
ncbi:MAG TPA: hypothetical protein VFA39_17470 [Steroidobacteraceae bacterium]|nr:hypothetical protein [Steroidobacteraceae bacterium]